MSERIYEWGMTLHRRQRLLLEKARMDTRAYLLYGAARDEKAFIAQRYAAMLLCLNDVKKPCGACVSCVRTSMHPDSIELRADSRATQVGVEEVRAFNASLFHKPFVGSFRIGILAEAEQLSHAAVNVLLKMLEDGPSHAVLILISDSLRSLPATVVSRCMLIKFNRLSNSEMNDFLDSQDCTAEQRSAAVSLSGGSVEVAKKLLSDQGVGYLSTTRKILALLTLSPSEAFTALPEMSLAPKKASQDTEENQSGAEEASVDILELLLHDLLVIKNGVPQAVHNTQLQQELITHASRTGSMQLLKQISLIHNYKEAARINPNIHLTLENVLLAGML